MALLRIATRESPLALRQTHIVKDAIVKHFSGSGFDIIILPMTTTGDQLLDKSLAAEGGKGLFLKEIEKALLDNKADIAVHSAKDMPVEMTEGLEIAAYVERDDPRDVFLSTHYSHLSELPVGAVVGTSSPRRESMLKAFRPDVTVKLLRGNIQTRIRKMEEGGYDGIIVAAAALHRMGLQAKIRHYFSVDESVPAIGQGIIAVQTRGLDKAIQQYISFLDHTITRACITAERAVNKALQGNCHSPIGAYAEYDDKTNELYLRARFNQLSYQGRDKIENAEVLGRRVGEALKHA